MKQTRTWRERNADLVPTMILFPTALREALHDHAQRAGLSMAAVVRAAVIAYLAEHGENVTALANLKRHEAQPAAVFERLAELERRLAALEHNR